MAVPSRECAGHLSFCVRRRDGQRPSKLDGHKLEGFWRAHQIPIPDVAINPEHLKILEDWLRSYKPAELFDRAGKLVSELRELAPKGDRRISANPHANGGLLRVPLQLPDFRKHAVPVPSPGASETETTFILGQFLRDVMRGNMNNFRIFGPDETASNRLQAIYEVTKKTWLAGYLPEDTDGGELSPAGRVMEEAQRTHSGRLGRGLCLNWPSCTVRLLRSFLSHRRLHVQPARKMAGEV